MWNLSLSKADWQSFPKFANTVKGGRVLRVPYLAHVLSPPPPERQRASEGVRIVAERRFKSTVRSDCFREEGGLTREGDEEREAEWLSSLLRRNPLYLSLNTYFEVVSRRGILQHRGSGRGMAPLPSGGPKMSP